MKNLFFYLRGLIGFVIGFLVVIGFLSLLSLPLPTPLAPALPVMQLASRKVELLAAWVAFDAPPSNEILNSFVV